MICTSCGEERDDVERRYSFGIYAGRLCEDCCHTYRDHCGLDQPQGAVEELAEFELGGYDAIYGEGDW